MSHSKQLVSIKFFSWPVILCFSGSQTGVWEPNFRSSASRDEKLIEIRGELSSLDAKQSFEKFRYQAELGNEYNFVIGILNLFRISYFPNLCATNVSKFCLLCKFFTTNTP